MDAPEPTDPASRKTSASAATAAELERLNARLGRMQTIVWGLIVVVGVVVVVEVIQLLR